MARENTALAKVLPRMLHLVARVGLLNPDAGEIGPGMLRQLVDEARSIQKYIDDNTRPE